MSVFNKSNTEWKEGKYSLFLGQEPALYDSINTTFPKLFKLYKDQKQADWSENEISLEQSRIDMMTCPPEARDMMLKNLALQWEADSVASRSIAPLFAPFITNSEYWAAILKISEIEVLHALTYSEIVRQCLDDPNEIFEDVMKNEAMFERLDEVSYAFSRLKRVGAELTLDMISKEDAYCAVMRALVALYCLERLQFMASFAATFAVVEAGYFQGIGKLVQKIMQDERFIHAEVGKAAIGIELATERGQAWLAADNEYVKDMIDSVVEAEYTWCRYLFSEGRKVVGASEQSFTDWVDYNAQDVYETLGFEPPRKVKANPLKYMDNWLDLNKNQNAQQEGDSANYSLNIIVDDLQDEVIEYDFSVQ
jgi:ribonucleoside-diphosphate reductase beta chain